MVRQAQHERLNFLSAKKLNHSKIKLVLVRGVWSLAVKLVLPSRSGPRAARVGHVQVGVSAEVADAPANFAAQEFRGINGTRSGP
jgi:hypothetical protein